MTEYVELYIDQGTDFVTSISISDDDTNSPVPLNDLQVSGQLRKSLLSQNTSEVFVCSVTDVMNGEITISMASANTANLKPGRYFFDISTNTNNIRARLIEGIVTVTPAITR